MKNKALDKYKEKLSNLSEEEKKERDLYLRNLSSGEIQGPSVGHTSIDKPWLKYFSEEEIMASIPKKTCYEMLFDNNKMYKDSCAFEYLGKKISYGTFFEMIENAKKALIASNVKKGDIVTICSITTPEVLALFYALNRIGAIPNFIDVRYTSKAIKEYIVETKSTKIFTLDLCVPRIKDIIDSTDVDEVICINPANVAPKLVTILSKLSSKLKKYVPKQSKYVDWNDFIKRKSTEEYEQQYEPDYPAAIVHTGGTTGVPKGVVLSNDDFNSVTYQVTTAKTSQRRGYRFLNIMPPFIAYGLGLGLYAPLVLGWETIVIPDFSPEKFSKLLKKHRPNGVMGVPIYWESVMNDKSMDNFSLDFLEDVLVGGDKTQPAYEDKVNKYLKNHHSSAVLSKGYSMTEASSLATFSNKYVNAKESVGAPLVKTVVAAFEPGTQEELTTGQVGELCIQSTNLMNEYYGNEEETKKVKQEHVDGNWVHSGDIGYVDENGIVYVKDRIKRMIIRSGFKVFPSEIEKVISNLDFVETCAAVGIPDEKDVTAPKLYIVLKKDCTLSQNEINDRIYAEIRKSQLPPYFEPVDIETIESMPITLIGKIDYNKLIEMNNEKKVSIK